jgi:hypothetical protein
MYFRCLGEKRIYCMHLKAGYGFIIHNHPIVPTFVLKRESQNIQCYEKHVSTLKHLAKIS